MFVRYFIAGLRVDIDTASQRLRTQASAYLGGPAGDADVRVKLPEDFFARQIERNPHLTKDDLEYILTGMQFFHQGLKYGRFFLHSSAVEFEGRAYLFSADPGTGKSTHARMWIETFGADRVRIINDDKPVIYKKDGVYVACGTPWSGKTDLNLNIEVPVGGVAVLERGAENSIEKISAPRALSILFSQTYRPYDVATADANIKLIGDFLNSVPLYRLRCNISREAAQVAWDGMKND